MVVNNKTHLSGEKIRDVLIKSAKKNNFSRSIYILVVGLCGIGILSIGLATSQNTFTLMGAVFTGFAIVYFLFVFLNYKKQIKKIDIENEKLFESGIDYNFIFKEQSIKVDAIETDKRNKKEYSYKEIRKIFEYDDYFEIIFIDTLIAYVSKSGFENPRMIDFFKKNIEINKKKIKNKCKSE